MNTRSADHRARVAVTAAALLALACASDGAEPTARPGLAAPGPPGRICRFAHLPGTSPSFGDLARAGTRGNIALWGRDMDAADTVELSVRYAEDGRLLWVETLRTTVPLDRAAALEELVLGALDEAERADWGVRILVAAGDVAEVAPSVICEPAVRRIGPVQPGFQAVRDYYLVEGRRYPVEVALDERGNILGIQLLRSTQSRAVNDFVRSYVWNTDFAPKLHDGIGLPSTLRTHVEFPRIRR